MSEFEGSKIRVRCSDCTHLMGNRCGPKGSKVSIKKRRTCSQYSFKGEFSNRSPRPAPHLPFIDSKTRRAIKKLIKLGVLNSNTSSPIPPPVLDPTYAPRTSAFKSTATANIPVVAPLESVGQAVFPESAAEDPEEKGFDFTPAVEK